MTDDTARTTAIETDIVSRTAEESDLEHKELADALELLDAELQGRHSEFETYSYVAVEDRRAYAIDTDVWGELLDPHDFRQTLESAVQQAHERQAEALFVASEGDSGSLEDSSGVVVGIDTAEQFE